jgi:ribosome-associated protein
MTDLRIKKPTNLIEDRMQNVTFDLEGEFVELNQLLKLAGLCDSGGAGKNMVASGVVAVDGKRELRKTAKIRSGQTVSVGDVRIRVQ